MKIFPRLKMVSRLVFAVLFDLVVVAVSMVIAILGIYLVQEHLFDYASFLHKLPSVVRWLNNIGVLIYLVYWNGRILYRIIFKIFLPYLYMEKQQLGLLVPRELFGYFMSLFAIFWPFTTMINYFFHKWLDDCPYFLMYPDKKISKIIKFLIFKVVFQFIDFGDKKYWE